MLFKLTIKNIVENIAKIWQWLFIYVVPRLILQYQYESKHIFILDIMFLIILAPYFLLLINQFIYSFQSIELKLDGIKYGGESVLYSEIESITLVTTENRKVSDSNGGYAPWLDGVIYYFDIKTKNNKNLICTCLMDTNKQFETVLQNKGLELEVKFNMFPIIFK
tara:strand:+ start:261 stop:755 length:495 start_codon:yes stop_codon:yes gene_type:complete